MAVIKTLKDKLGNILYPQTRTTAVFDGQDRVLENVLAGKEDTSNKASTITNDATKYPSAAAIYNYIASGNAGGVRNVAGSSFNANNINATGFYYVTGSVFTNLPVNTNGYIIVASRGNTQNYVLQIYVPYNSNFMYTRVNNNGTWTSWQRLVNASEAIPCTITLADGTTKSLTLYGVES